MTCLSAGIGPWYGIHQSRLMMAPSSDVGSCIYCADQCLTDNDALTFSNSSRFQYSGHTELPLGKIAGKETCLHVSALGSVCAFNNLPVKSSCAQRVITKTIEPLGCKR